MIPECALSLLDMPIVNFQQDLKHILDANEDILYIDYTQNDNSLSLYKIHWIRRFFRALYYHIVDPSDYIAQKVSHIAQEIFARSNCISREPVTSICNRFLKAYYLPVLSPPTTRESTLTTFLQHSAYAQLASLKRQGAPVAQLEKLLGDLKTRLKSMLPPNDTVLKPFSMGLELDPGKISEALLRADIYWKLGTRLQSASLKQQGIEEIAGAMRAVRFLISTLENGCKVDDIVVPRDNIYQCFMEGSATWAKQAQQGMPLEQFTPPYIFSIDFARGLFRYIKKNDANAIEEQKDSGKMDFRPIGNSFITSIYDAFTQTHHLSKEVATVVVHELEHLMQQMSLGDICTRTLFRYIPDEWFRLASANEDSKPYCEVVVDKKAIHVTIQRLFHVVPYFSKETNQSIFGSETIETEYTIYPSKINASQFLLSKGAVTVSERNLGFQELIPIE